MPAVDSIWFATLSAAERTELESAAREPILKTPDVLVVGGGIIGLATAYFLAERGARVQLIEAETIASGASGANAGGIWPNDQGPSHTAGFQQLAFLSRDLWGRLVAAPRFRFRLARQWPLERPTPKSLPTRRPSAPPVTRSKATRFMRSTAVRSPSWSRI